MKPQEWIELVDAVKLITKHLYPKEQRSRNAKNRIRQNIYRAVKRGELTRFGPPTSGKFKYDSFIFWAKNRWPELRSIDALPHVIKPDTGEIHTAAGRPRADVFSNDPEELKDQLI